ncbi:hypothetical protein FALCPG4_006401 [Fusarium falciforme]
MLDILDLFILLFTHMFFYKIPLFSKALAATNSQRPHWHESTSCIHLRATIPPKQRFSLCLFLKSKQNSSLDGQDWDTTSYELQQGAGEASDWQDRESEKLEPPGSKHLAGVFVTKGGWGFS